MKAIKCELWVGTACSFIPFMKFDSINQAKKHIKHLDAVGFSAYKEIIRL